jgi:hypothetical protein
MAQGKQRSRRNGSKKASGIVINMPKPSKSSSRGLISNRISCTRSRKRQRSEDGSTRTLGLGESRMGSRPSLVSSMFQRLVLRGLGSSSNSLVTTQQPKRQRRLSVSHRHPSSGIIVGSEFRVGCTTSPNPISEDVFKMSPASSLNSESELRYNQDSDTTKCT